MSVARVLVIDDEASYRAICCRFLSARGYQTAAAASADEAANRIMTSVPHVALLDIVMPRMDGIEFLRILRRSPATSRLPVILMTGLAAPDSLLSSAASSLDTGAIFRKGHDLHDLLKRIDLAVRAAPANETLRGGARRFERGEVVVDPDLRKVWVKGRPVALPLRRFELLCALLESEVPHDRDALRRRVWPDSDNPAVVDVNIHRLRRDLGDCPSLRIESTSRGYHLIDSDD